MAVPPSTAGLQAVWTESRAAPSRAKGRSSSGLRVLQQMRALPVVFADPMAATDSTRTLDPRRWRSRIPQACFVRPGRAGHCAHSDCLLDETSALRAGFHVPSLCGKSPLEGCCLEPIPCPNLSSRNAANRIHSCAVFGGRPNQQARIGLCVDTEPMLRVPLPRRDRAVFQIRSEGSHGRPRTDHVHTVFHTVDFAGEGLRDNWDCAMRTEPGKHAGFCEGECRMLHESESRLRKQASQFRRGKHTQSFHWNAVQLRRRIEWRTNIENLLDAKVAEYAAESGKPLVCDTPRGCQSKDGKRWSSAVDWRKNVRLAHIG